MLLSLLAITLALAANAPAQTPRRLTLKEAIERGLQHNLRVLVAGTQIEEAQGTRQRRLSALLPVARAETYANLQNRNLRAFGLNAPGIPDVIGPFSNFDVRAYVEQPILDLRSYRRWQASQQQERATREQYQDVRELIIRQVASLYLNAQAADARATAAASRVATAQALYEMARDQRQAGVATGVDVLRAQVELANEQQRLLEARNTAQQARLILARAIGLNLGEPLELAEPLEYNTLPSPDIPSALAGALERRPDYLALQTQQQALATELQANRARYYPRLGFAGNIGGLGRAYSEMKTTGLMQGTLSITLFDADRKGERMELESRRRRLEHQLADLRQGIEQEIRDALLLLESAADEVSVAAQGRTLAERELEMARDRFQAGVTNNIEVITAQEALARAQENYIFAVTRHTDAKSALARALGGLEESYPQFLNVH
ncbi:MAG TPA: TolC family protein [Candidatus Xenobia bacterium]|nr:TolC family protein [Candidatus Xenobia bacterium]